MPDLSLNSVERSGTASRKRVMMQSQLLTWQRDNSFIVIALKGLCRHHLRISNSFVDANKDTIVSPQVETPSEQDGGISNR
jgi:hypothetical protein